MKNNYFNLFTVVLLFFFSIYSNAQKKSNTNSSNKNQSEIEYSLTTENKKSLLETGYVRCLTVENEEALQKKYPNRYTNKQFENWLKPKISELKSKRLKAKNQKSTKIYNIPVVIHIIHNGDPINTIGNIVGENISDAQAASQIEIMNQDFRRMVGTPGGANSTGLAVDVEINFCLAAQDENGFPTTGIIRHNIAPYSNNVVDGSGGPDWETRNDVETMKANTQWDPTKYLNMWTFRPGGNDLNQGGLNGLLGYAQFPSNSGLVGLNNNGGAANTDGVVAGFDAFGSIAYNDGSFNMNNTYNLGRTMTHEVGHWLGLRHVWGDKQYDFQNGCDFDDYCDDTPNTETANYYCNVVNTCPEPPPAVYDMVENYMDYTNDACMDTFTQDQKDRMVVVMENSPRRKELINSIGCEAPIPSIYFNNSETTVIEGTSCGYKDIAISVSIAKAPSEDAIISFNYASGTATQGDDFSFQNSSVVFLAGQTDSKTLILRIYEDSFEEIDESITIGMSISTSGDAIITTTGNYTFTLNVIDDDTRNIGITTIFSEDFETYTDFSITNIGGWTMLDVDGNTTYGIDNNTSFPNQGYTGTFIVFNPSQTTPSTSPNWDPHSGNKGYYCFNATDIPNGTAKNDDYIFSPQINLNGTNSELKFWAKSITNQYGLERFNVLVSTTDTNITSFTRILPVSPVAGTNYEEAPINWTEFTYDLSSYDGEQIHIAYHVISEDAFAFMLDDISVKTLINLEVQTTINTPDQNALNSAGTIFANNNLNNNLVVDISNNDGKEYGCVDAFVSRAFDVNNPAVQQQASGVANYAMSKMFTITPETIHATGDVSLKFYFTELEISSWETATGNNRSSLTIYKDNGTTIEPVIGTLGLFDNAITLSADFATGLQGDYFFGSSTVLSVTKNEFNLFSVFPNPPTNELNIALSSSKDMKITVFDVLGREIYTTIFINNSSPFIRKIPITLVKGIYILKVESDDKIATKKIIIE
jgi:hypothetical protein